MQNILDMLKAGDGAISAALWIGLGIVILIVVVFVGIWIVRAVRPTLNMSGSSSRGGRPQRLAVTDAFNLDREGRKLVIIRRDNTEHLLLIGGPNDVIVESNIVRGERAVRDRTGREGGETVFPAEVQPAPEPARPAPTASVAPPSPTIAPQPAAPMAAPSGPTLSPIRPAAPPPPARPAPPPPPPPPLPSAPAGKAAEATQGAAAKLDDEFERALAAMQSVQRQPTTAPPPPRAAEPTPAPASAQRPAPPPPLMPPMTAESVVPAPRPPIQPAPIPSAPPVQTVQPRVMRTDASSEMARRLNEVMQKPLNPAPRPVGSDTQPPAAMTRPAPPAPAPAPPPASPAAPSAGSEMDLLEEEMARLLGRSSPQRKPDAP